ncbi:hypothetical protein [Brachybacterium sp.]|uniref:hypothetical protein n=1 Tax=Brachybacterium sp. TaxID=1891286 RepID=UPI002ED19D5E
MAVNEDHRQTEIAREAAQSARTLAHSTRDVPTPSDSYVLLGELGATVDHLEQVCRQLSRWHAATQEPEHFTAEDPRGDGTGTTTAAAELEAAAVALNTASAALMRAHAANGVVRWTA